MTDDEERIMCKGQARARLAEAENLTRAALGDVQVVEGEKKVVAEGVRQAIRALGTARTMLDKLWLT